MSLKTLDNALKGSLQHCEKGMMESQDTVTAKLEGYSTESFDIATSAPSYKRILWKIDLRILLITSIGFFLLNLTRASFANALVMNNDIAGGTMKEQLNITDERYSVLIMVYTAVFIVFELPSNLLLKYIAARHHIARIAVGWGIVAMCGAATTNFNGMLANRLFLAVAHAGYFPSVIYVMRMWYTESQLAFRFAIFVAAAILSGAFSGLFATACSYLNNKAHLTGWMWLLILTGRSNVKQSDLVNAMEVSHPCWLASGFSFFYQTIRRQLRFCHMKNVSWLYTHYVIHILSVPPFHSAHQRTRSSDLETSGLF